jgi:hypothetical protein
MMAATVYILATIATCFILLLGIYCILFICMDGRQDENNMPECHCRQIPV